MAQQVDVVICGGGSAGLCAGVWLARCGVSFQILERGTGPLENGQADGVQCRTVELFESFGLADALLKEAYHVTEITLWAPDSERRGGIRRTHFTSDKQRGLSHQPHVTLNQAAINRILTDEMEHASGRPCVEYGCEVLGVEVDGETARDPDQHCVTVRASKDGVERLYRAKYVLGSDGAHSIVRKSLGFQMVGDTTDAVWGVMDIYPRTSFPDIRRKVMVNSEAGNALIIPREGDYMIRIYIELKGAAGKDVTLDEIMRRARLILSPYTLEAAETVWWSAYSIGQRLADKFHQDYRVFLGGDACHTHSPKAGQGMNVSIQDGYNIGWKLAAVLRGRAGPEILETYVSERQKVAADLIDFDRRWSRLFSSTYRRENGVTSEQVHAQTVLHARFTSGMATRYEDSSIVSAAASEAALAANITVGMRFPSAEVIRHCDARETRMVLAMPADSRWHVVVFAGDIRERDALERLRNFSIGLESVIDAVTPPDADRDTVVNPLLILSSGHTETELDQVPPVFTPTVSKWRIKSLLKVFVDEEGYHSPHGHAYDIYGIDPGRGAVVIVRPDHYISKICSLADIGAVKDFFFGFMKRIEE
ncbi:FAD binding domain-containing protein [Durotheca rogersii]|uniref:FAD binding domain-containing protein n=1 Tax=Durotheca rogersii TaxID=419775 RepID=UPI00221F9306|nr:FAD binding domain-containing protein [Durotheca rogersii]KAI5863347.1 FAD binding domain-containing protein [Durotheca rogersii]